MFSIKFVRYPALITYLCHTYLITTFRLLCIEYRPIYQILEFLYSLVSVLAWATKISYQLGPSLYCAVLNFLSALILVMFWYGYTVKRIYPLWLQVFLLGRELSVVRGQVWWPPAVGPAQQHRHHEDPCTLRFSSSSHIQQLISFLILSLLCVAALNKDNCNMRIKILIMQILDCEHCVFVQVLSLPCGWMSCATQWSQVEKTDRQSSGRFRVKHPSLHNHKLGEIKDFQCNILTGLYWPSILLMTQLSDPQQPH